MRVAAAAQAAKQHGPGTWLLLAGVLQDLCCPGVTLECRSETWGLRLRACEHGAHEQEEGDTARTAPYDRVSHPQHARR